MTKTITSLMTTILCVSAVLPAVSQNIFRWTTATNIVKRYDSGRMFDKYGALRVKEQIVAMMIGGGHREKFTVELWMWPLEASDDLPRFQPGVDEAEVSIIKGVEV